MLPEEVCEFEKLASHNAMPLRAFRENALWERSAWREA
jgi:hypothetical protein